MEKWKKGREGRRESAREYYAKKRERENMSERKVREEKEEEFGEEGDDRKVKMMVRFRLDLAIMHCGADSQRTFIK